MTNAEPTRNSRKTKAHRPSVVPWHLAVSHSGFGHALVMRIFSFVAAWVIMLTGFVPRLDAADNPPPPLKVVLWTGGFAHSFEKLAAAMKGALPRYLPVKLAEVGDGRFLEGPDDQRPDVILMNHCFESAEGVLTKAQQETLLRWVRQGVGVVAVHASYYSFPKWKAIREMYGTQFIEHGEVDVFLLVSIVDDKHPVTRGVPPTLQLHSELYQSRALPKDCHLLATARERDGKESFPSVWTRQFGKGRVVTILPAHWPDAYEDKGFQRLIANSVGWVAGDQHVPERGGGF